MKARVKATGQIVALDPRCNVTEIVKGGHPRMWTLAELELEDDPDYWTRLEHQYAGMAMQGMLNNSYLAGEFRKDPNNGIEDMSKIITKATAVYAHALVEMMKEADR